MRSHQPPTLAHFVAAAVIAHEIVLAGALALAPAHGQARGFDWPQLEVLIEAPAFAHPPPPREPESVEAPAAARQAPPRPARDVEPAEPTVVRAERAVVAAADAVARAAKILVRDDAAPDAPAIASGDDSGIGYGMVAGGGTGAVATWSRRAAIGGKSGGKGVDTSAAAEVAPDRSRAAHVIGGFADDCDFPPEAGEMNHAVVVVTVTVRSDGTAAAVAVVSDPGHGFGRVARSCALGRLYTPARDREGRPVPGVTAPVNVRFRR